MARGGGNIVLGRGRGAVRWRGVQSRVAERVEGGCDPWSCGFRDKLVWLLQPLLSQLAQYFTQRMENTTKQRLEKDTKTGGHYDTKTGVYHNTNTGECCDTKTTVFYYGVY